MLAVDVDEKLPEMQGKQELDSTFKNDASVESGVFSGADTDTSKDTCGGDAKQDGPGNSSGLENGMEACSISTIELDGSLTGGMGISGLFDFGKNYLILKGLILARIYVTPKL